jgi:hypothetical protein
MMRDETGADVSTDAMWRSSMMANAARDPYWLASVRGEVLAHPDYQAVIEDKCATCHTPMAHFTVATEDGESALLDQGFLTGEHALHGLAVDGVSCTLCHQILEGDFGEPDSFSGGFAVDTALPPGQREAFGPHPVDPGLASIMQGASGFTTVESQHVEAAELCATCHTLYTPYVDASGAIAGVFPEQMAYLEWLASSFGGAVSCQGCHMPAADGGVQLSVTGGPLRSPVHQHEFVGGNAYILRVLETFGEELQVTASSAQFRDKQAGVIEQLQERTATLEIESAEVAGTQLVVDVAISSLVGHKLPTGFPSRRAWIHLVVEDSDGEVVFESGGVEANGAIVGNDNDLDAGLFEEHHSSIEGPDEVQIYETILADTGGSITTVLLKGAGYLKDNRLLPSGFEKEEAHADIAVHGAALVDEDFAGGGDRVSYVVDVSRNPGPYSVMASLLYQSIGYRWTANLGDYDAEEPRAFTAFYEQVANDPVVISSAALRVDKDE